MVTVTITAAHDPHSRAQTLPFPAVGLLPDASGPPTEKQIFDQGGDREHRQHEEQQAEKAHARGRRISRPRWLPAASFERQAAVGSEGQLA